MIVAHSAVQARVLRPTVAHRAGPRADAPQDSFTPITLTTTIASTLHVGTQVPIKVRVTADPGVLDTADAQLKVEVALMPECEGTFAQSAAHGGIVLMNRPLSPQPVSGRAYSATASTTYGTPRAKGTDTVCVWLVQQSDQRVYASDQSITVTVAKARARRRHTSGKKTSTPTTKKTRNR